MVRDRRHRRGAGLVDHVGDFSVARPSTRVDIHDRRGGRWCVLTRRQEGMAWARRRRTARLSNEAVSTDGVPTVKRTHARRSVRPAKTDSPPKPIRDARIRTIKICGPEKSAAGQRTATSGVALVRAFASARFWKRPFEHSVVVKARRFPLSMPRYTEDARCAHR
jgi:hypothetical protein